MPPYALSCLQVQHRPLQGFCSGPLVYFFLKITNLLKM